MLTVLSAGVAEISAAEKPPLVEDLWDELAATGAEFPLTPAQQKLLRAERKAICQDPAAGSDWPTVKTRLLRGS